MTQVAVKERGIIFSTDMVKAILDRTKTQTRRVIKPQPENGLIHFSLNGRIYWRDVRLNLNEIPWGDYKLCPYGQVGDRLWVKETFSTYPTHYRADGYELQDGEGRWHPSIFMPRRVSRIDLEITDLRMERLQEITEGDAKREGDPQQGLIASENCHTVWFQSMWNFLNAKRGYEWEGNWWVWVLGFKLM